MYIFVFFSLIMSWLLFDSLMGGQGGTLEELETKRAPSFCRSEGAFLSVEKKQTVYPQVLDSWMSHFDSQLQNCFVRDGKPEVPGLGVLSPEGRQDLHLVPNFDSQLQSCFKQPEQLEVLGLGDVLPFGGLHDLHHGAIFTYKTRKRKIPKISLLLSLHVF